MAKQKPQQQGPGRGAKAVQNARRLWPYFLMAWQRWQALPPEQKERYRRQAGEYAQRGRKVIEDQRRKRGRP